MEKILKVKKWRLLNRLIDAINSNESLRKFVDLETLRQNADNYSLEQYERTIDDIHERNHQVFKKIEHAQERQRIFSPKKQIK